MYSTPSIGLPRLDGLALLVEREHANRNFMELLKREFSHRMRNQLQIISSYFHLLSSGPCQPDDLSRRLDACFRAAVELHDLIYECDGENRVAVGALASRISLLVNQLRGADEPLMQIDASCEDLVTDGENALMLALLLADYCLDAGLPGCGQARNRIAIRLKHYEGCLELVLRSDDGSAPLLDLEETVGPSYCYENEAIDVVDAVRLCLQSRSRQTGGAIEGKTIAIRLAK